MNISEGTFSQVSTHIIATGLFRFCIIRNIFRILQFLNKLLNLFDTSSNIFSSPDNLHRELLYYPGRHRPRPWQHWRPQMLKFSLKFLRPHYFLTLSSI